MAKETMPKINAKSVILRVHGDATSTIEFMGVNGKRFDVRILNSALDKLFEHLAAAREKGFTFSGQVNPATQIRTLLGTEAEWSDAKKFDVGPHGAVQVGMSIDMKKVWLRLSADTKTHFEVMMPLDEARPILDALNEATSLVALHQNDNTKH